MDKRLAALLHAHRNARVVLAVCDHQMTPHRPIMHRDWFCAMANFDPVALG
jgi:hypothetical protein